jgi:hypothetical protein
MADLHKQYRYHPGLTGDDHWPVHRQPHRTPALRHAWRNRRNRGPAQMDHMGQCSQTPGGLE